MLSKVNVVNEQHCESRRNWTQESTEFCTPWRAIDFSLEQRQRGVSDHGPLAAAVIGTPVRSRGRSRHGTCFEQAAEHACRTQAAKNAAFADHRQLAAPAEVVKVLCDVTSHSH